MTTPSRPDSGSGRLKSAARVSTSVAGNLLAISTARRRSAPASRSTAVMWAPGPRRSASAIVNAPSPAPRSAHSPPFESTPPRRRPTRSAWSTTRGHQLAHLRHELLDERLASVRTGDERVEPVLEHERGEVLRRQISPDVENAPYRGRIATRRSSGIVDAGVGLIHVVWLLVAERRHPPIGCSPRESEHPRPVRTEPDTDGMRGGRARVQARELVETPVELQPSATSPEQADHLDGLLQGAHGFAGRADRPSHRLDRRPEATRSEAELDSSA